MMNTSEVAIRCGEHAFTRLQKLLPQQDRLTFNLSYLKQILMTTSIDLMILSL